MVAWISMDNLAKMEGNEIIFLETKAVIYLRSIYWGIITLVTTGFGDLSAQSFPEILTSPFLFFAGYVCVCILIGILTNMVLRNSQAESDYLKRVDEITEYMNYRHLPNELRSRIRFFCSYHWNMLKGIDEDQFLSELPTSYNAQLTCIKIKDHIMSIMYFKEASSTFLNAIITQIESCIFSPGDYILPIGKINRDLYMINIGETIALDKAGKIIKRYGKAYISSYFGEFDIFKGNENQNLIISNGFCEIFILRQESFREIKKLLLTEQEYQKMIEKAINSEKQQIKKYKLNDDSEDNKYKEWMTVFLPLSNFRNVLGSLNLIFFIYLIVSAPIGSAYFFYIKDDLSFIIFIAIDVLCDVTFLIETIFKIFLYAYTENGVVVCNRIKIRENFFKEKYWFFDVLSLIPIQYFCTLWDTRYYSIIRLLKLFRIRLIYYYISSFKDLLSHYSLSINNNLSKAIEFISLLLIYSLYTSCGLYLLSCFIKFNIPNEKAWIDVDNENPKTSIDHSSLNNFVGIMRSFYFVIIGVTTVGYGDIIPSHNYETIYISIVVLVGGIMYPAIIGTLASVMMHLNAARQDFKHKITSIRKFMDMKAYKRKIKDKIIRYYDYIWSRQHGIDESFILITLSTPLRVSALEFVIGGPMKRTAFLSKCEPDCLKDLYLNCEPAIFLPEDELIMAGTMPIGMFFLENGMAQVKLPEENLIKRSLDLQMESDLRCEIDFENTTIKILYPGSYVGEFSLINHISKVSVIAMTYCDCFLLRKEFFDQVIVQYSKSRVDILENIKKEYLKSSQMYESIKSNLSKKDKVNKAAGNIEILENEVSIKSIRHPESFIRKIWMIFCLLVSLYEVLSIPMKLVVFNDLQFYYCIIDWCIDVVLIVNYFFNLYYFGYMSEGQLVFEPKDISLFYKSQGTFVMDSIALFPYEIFIPFLLIVGYPTEEILNVYIPIFRLPKLLLCAHFGEYFESLSRLAEEFPSIPESVPELFKLFIMVILVAHLFACGFLFLAIYQKGLSYPFKRCGDQFDKLDEESINDFGLNGYANCIFQNTWIELQINKGFLPYNAGNVAFQYLRSLYWAISTLICVVIGDVTPTTNIETIYLLFTILVGVVINSSIIGNIANIASNLEGEEAILREEIDGLSTYMDAHRIEPSVKNKCLNYMNYILKTTQGYDENAIINDLPITLKEELLTKKGLSFIQNCAIFKDLFESFYKEMSLKLIHTIYTPDELIFSRDDNISSIYFIINGSVSFYNEEIICQNSLAFITLTGGFYFGEMFMFFQEPALYSAKSDNYTEIFSLSKQDIQLLMRLFEINENIIFNNLSELINFKEKDEFCFNNVIGREYDTCSSHRNSVDNGVEIPIKSHYIINSDNKFYITWRFIEFVIIVYYIISVPYIIAFNDPNLLKSYTTLFRSYGILVTIDFLGFLFFGVDSYLRSRHISITIKGQIINRPEEIRKNYLQNDLLLDVLSIMPLSLIAIFNLEWLPLLRINYLLHLLRYNGCFTFISSFLSVSSTTLTISGMRIFNQFFLFLLFVHSSASIHFIVHRYLIPTASMTEFIKDGLSTYDPITDSHNIKNDDVEFYKIYIRSFYASMNILCTIGFGDFTPFHPVEIIISLCLNIIGASFQASIIGVFCAYLTLKDNSGFATHKQKLIQINNYLQLRNVPSDLKKSINYYFNYLWRVDNGVVRPKLLENLPERLKMDIMYSIYEYYFKTIEELKCLSLDVQRLLSLNVSVFSCQPMEYIYKIGDIPEDVFILLSGRVELTDEARGQRILDSNHIFGDDIDFIRIQNAQAICTCELLVIKQDALMDIYQSHNETRVSKLFASFTNILEFGKAKRRSQTVSKTRKLEDQNVLFANGTIITKKNFTIFDCFPKMKYDYCSKGIRYDNKSKLGGVSSFHRSNQMMRSGSGRNLEKVGSKLLAHLQSVSKIKNLTPTFSSNSISSVQGVKSQENQSQKSKNINVSIIGDTSKFYLDQKPFLLNNENSFKTDSDYSQGEYVDNNLNPLIEDPEELQSNVPGRDSAVYSALLFPIHYKYARHNKSNATTPMHSTELIANDKMNLFSSNAANAAIIPQIELNNESHNNSLRISIKNKEMIHTLSNNLNSSITQLTFRNPYMESPKNKRNSIKNTGQRTSLNLTPLGLREITTMNEWTTSAGNFGEIDSGSLSPQILVKKRSIDKMEDRVSRSLRKSNLTRTQFADECFNSSKESSTDEEPLEKEIVISSMGLDSLNVLPSGFDKIETIDIKSIFNKEVKVVKIENIEDINLDTFKKDDSSFDVVVEMNKKIKRESPSKKKIKKIKKRKEFTALAESSEITSKEDEAKIVSDHSISKAIDFLPSLEEENKDVLTSAVITKAESITNMMETTNTADLSEIDVNDKISPKKSKKRRRRIKVIKKTVEKPMEKLDSIIITPPISPVPVIPVSDTENYNNQLLNSEIEAAATAEEKPAKKKKKIIRRKKKHKDE